MPSNDPTARRTRCTRRTRPVLAGLLGAVLAGSLLTAPSAAAGNGAADGVGHGSTAKPMSDAERSRKALRVARRQVGDAYKYGAEGPDRFDCSGLVYFATHRAGFSDVPRTSSEQGHHMRRIKRKELRPGDFVFFTKKGDVYHVGFYGGRHDGNRMVLHAPSSGEQVSRERIWTDSWFAATLRGA